MHNRLLTILLRKLNIVRVREEWTPPCKAEEGVDVTPSTTDDNAAGGDEMVILILIMIETSH